MRRTQSHSIFIMLIYKQLGVFRFTLIFIIHVYIQNPTLLGNVESTFCHAFS